MIIEIFKSNKEVLGLVKVTNSTGVEVQDKGAVYNIVLNTWVKFRSFKTFKESEALNEFIGYFNIVCSHQMELYEREAPFCIGGANATELVLTEIELRDSNEAIYYEIYFCPDLNLFYATNPLKPSAKPILYKLNVSPKDLSIDKKREILEYRLGVDTNEAEPTLGDVFMHGEYITKL